MQSLQLAEGKPFDEVCVNSNNPNELRIRLGRDLGFIKRFVLTADKVIHNIHYSGAAYTPTQIVEFFKSLRATTGRRSKTDVEKFLFSLRK